MTLRTRFLVLMAVMVLGAVGAVGAASRVSAQAALPYLAYGMGVKGGQVVEAFAGDVSVGRVAANAAGQWRIYIQPGADVVNGTRISFTLDGAPSGKTVVFESGHFTPPPGVVLGASVPVASVRASAPAPSLVATPEPSSTPRVAPTPKPACTKNGRPIACATPAPKPTVATHR